MTGILPFIPQQPHSPSLSGAGRIQKYVTAQMVTQPNTNQVQHCSTSVIDWEVHSSAIATGANPQISYVYLIVFLPLLEDLYLRPSLIKSSSLKFIIKTGVTNNVALFYSSTHFSRTMSNSSDYQDLVSQIFRKFDQYGPDTLGDHQIDVDLLKALSKLIADRRNASSLLNDEEYLQKKLQSIQTGGEETEEVCYSDDTIKRDILVNMCRALGDDESNETARKDSLFYMYLTFRKYEIVMKEILEGFNCDRKINTRNLDVARVILLVLMFYLNESNMNKVKQVLLKFNAFLTEEIVGFLSLHDIKETMCKYLDREYVDDVLEVRTTQELLQKLQDEMVEIDEQSEEKSEIPRFVCKPFKTNYVRTATKLTPMPSEGEGDQNFVFKANPIPYDILNVDEEEMLRKKEKRLKKREIEARKLLEEANKKQFKCARNIGKKKDTKFDETMKFKVSKRRLKL